MLQSEQLFSSFQKLFYIKIVLKRNNFLIFAVEIGKGGGGGVTVINYLLVATAIQKISKIKIKVLIKKKNEQTMQATMPLFRLQLRAAPAAKIFKPGSK